MRGDYSKPQTQGGVKLLSGGSLSVLMLQKKTSRLLFFHYIASLKASMMYFGGLESVLSIPFCTVCVLLLHFLERKITQNSYIYTVF